MPDVNVMSGPSLKGYKKKPLPIVLVAGAFLCIPGAVLLQAAVLSGGSWPVVLAVAGSRYFLLEWWLSWSAAAAVYIVSRWSFAYFVALSGYALVTKAIRLGAQPELETPLSLLITGFWLGAVIAFLGSSLKVPYLNPKLQWWKRPPRVRICRNATVTAHGVARPVTVWNLSQGGAFVKLDERAAAPDEAPHRLGETVDFAMELVHVDEGSKPPTPFSARAQLVWMTKAESPYRDGIGMRFLSLSTLQRRQLQELLRHEARRTRHA